MLDLSKTSYFTDRSDSIAIVGDVQSQEACWRRVSDLTGGLLTPWGIRQLRKGLDGKVGTVFVENDYVCKDYKNLHSNFYSKKFLSRSPNCSRLHFFDQEGLSKDSVLIDPEGNQNSYLGYSVVEPLAYRCIGRTVLDAQKICQHNKDLYCLAAKFPVRIHGAEYHVNGFPYRSQTGEAIVCAHTALWGVCRYLSQRYSIYGELLPFDIIQKAGVARGRRVPNHGLTYSDYCEILAGFGCHPLLLRPRTAAGDRSHWVQDVECFYDLYAYMESGLPILASFGGHVVSIVGHTIQETQRPDHKPNSDGFVNSAAYLDRYTIVDDNFFPYQQLGYKDELPYFGEFYKKKRKPYIDNIYAAVVPLPEKVYMKASDARAKAYAAFAAPDVASLIRRTRVGLEDEAGGIVARQFVTSGAAFKIRKRTDWLASDDSATFYPLSVNLPHFVWVTELLTADLRGNQQAFAEIVVDATKGKADWEPIYIRVGNSVIAEGKLVDHTQLGAKLAFRQYIHNLGDPRGKSASV